jgi:hypothetical protein
MEFFGKQRWLFFGLFAVLFLILILRVVSPLYLFAEGGQPSTTAASSPSNSAQGSKVGNNLAIQFPQAGDNFSESAYTMAILSDPSDESVITDQIKNSSGTIVIRFGVGAAPMSATEYGNMLVRIAGAAGKPFVATANGNESNCAENRPIAAEVAFATTVASIAGNNPNITLITGQIDYYCDPNVGISRAAEGGGSPEAYRDALLAVPGIKGLAVPLYTGVESDVNATIKKLDDFIQNVSVDVYITEAGPLKGSFRDFVLALQQASTRSKVKAILLFDSHGLNPEFEFTKPFWSAACREALRTILGETDKVVAICEGDLTQTSYFEYNIQRSSTDTIKNNLLDEYSVSCLPKEDYELVKSNFDKCSLINGCNKWNVTGDISIDANGKMFGLLRDEKAVVGRTSTTKPTAPKRTESIEAYLGTSNRSAPSSKAGPTPVPTTKDVDTRQAPLFKLTTLQQQCAFVLNKLIAVKELCQNNRIEGDVEKAQKANPPQNTCALDTKIPGTDTTHLSLLSQVLPSADPTGVADACNKIVNIDEKNEQAKTTKDLVLSVPLAMETAYRPAFIVASTKFEGAKKQEAQNTSFSVNDTINSGDKPTDDYYVVDYFEVKVPAYGSDFIDPKSTITPSNTTANYQKRNLYADSLRLTADVITNPDSQIAFQENVDNDRQAIRAEAASNLQRRGSGDVGGFAIGTNREVIYCYKKGKLTECTPEGTPGQKYDPTKDALPPALIEFINAAIPTQNEGKTCIADEETFYSPENKKKVAEQAKKIGATLDTSDIGDVVKKKDLKIPFQVNIKDIREGGGISTATELYFVSPHNYNLKYAQKSFMSFLTLDQQAKLKSAGVLTETKSGDLVLSPEQFSPLLKTAINDKFTGNATTREGFIGDSRPTTVTAGTGTDDPNENQTKISISAKIVQPKGPDGDKKHPLFWQVAGQVASLPTRLMALVTTPLHSALNDYTLGCKGEFATEDWLLGKCKKKKDETKPEPVCKAGTEIALCKNYGPGNVAGGCAICKAGASCSSQPTGTGQTASISDGVIALAIDASKYTCTPAEVLVGVMAKETSGLTFGDVPVTGNPNEKVSRQFWCADSYFQEDQIMQNVSYNGNQIPPYRLGCGAYQFAQVDIFLELNRYGGKNTPDSSLNKCLSNLSADLDSGTEKLDLGRFDLDNFLLNRSDPDAAYKVPYTDIEDLDTRKLGVSMCFAAARLWRNGLGGGQTCSGNSAGDLSSVQGTLAAGLTGFHGNSEANGNYLAFIDQYKDRVAKVRQDMSQCK